MALSTAFTKLFGVRHPIALAPMGGSAGGALAAAVSRGGGLGLLGAGNGDRQWLARELPILAEGGHGQPWGIGFLTWAVEVAAVERALEHGPRAVMLSFGDPTPFAEIIRRAGAALILQVTDLEEARQAVDLGADVIVAQGSEGGGHGARRGRSTLPFVPVVVDLAAPVPVLAAGGIADGRGVAAALALGADRHPLPGHRRSPGRPRDHQGDPGGTRAPICHPRPTSSPPWPRRLRTRWLERDGTDRNLPGALGTGCRGGSGGGVLDTWRAGPVCAPVRPWGRFRGVWSAAARRGDRRAGPRDTRCDPGRGE